MGSIDCLRPAIHSSFTTYVHVNKTACKDLSKAYLQCRMDKVSKAGHAPSTSTLTYYNPRTRVSHPFAFYNSTQHQNLMQKEDLDKLGFKERGGEPQLQEQGAAGGGEARKGEGRDEAFYDRKREAEGFVAGTGVKSGRKGFFS